MPDMLVRLYDLPSLEQALAGAAKHGVIVRRAIAPEKPEVVDWVRAHFAIWAAEVETAFAQVPATCFVAVRESRHPRIRVPRRHQHELLRAGRRAYGRTR